MEEAFTVFPTCANAVQLAIRSKHAQVFKLLLDAGAHEMSASDQCNKSILQWAISVKNPEIVKIALRPGVDLMHKNRYGNTAFDIAVKRNFHEGIWLLREWQAQNTAS